MKNEEYFCNFATKNLGAARTIVFACRGSATTYGEEGCEGNKSESFCMNSYKIAVASVLLLCWAVVAQSRPAEKKAALVWTNVTSQHVDNATLVTDSLRGWSVESDCETWGVKDGCVEFCSGAFRLEQKLLLPPGHYRLTLQGFYRNDYNSLDNRNYREGNWVSQGFFFAGNECQPLKSVYAHGFDDNLYSSCWAYGKFFPAKAQVATYVFGKGFYVNSLEFDAMGDSVSIGVFNEPSAEADCWCALGRFTLERQWEAVDATPENVVINEVMSGNIDQFFSSAGNTDNWVELYNPTDSPVMTDGCYVSDDEGDLKKWRIPESAGHLPANGYMVLWFGSNDLVASHVPFTLDPDGGELFISDADGNLLTTCNYPAAKLRISYARTIDGGDTWAFTDTPTLGTSNDAAIYATIQLPDPVIDTDVCLYDEPFVLHVDIPEGQTLRYVAGNSTPTRSYSSVSKTGDFNISGNKLLRLRLYKDGFLPSNVVTRVFIKRTNDIPLPLVSLVAPSYQLYGDTLGMFAVGTRGLIGNGGRVPCNFNMPWQRSATFSYIIDGNEVLNQEVEIENAGAYSRWSSPNTVKFKAKKVYGKGKTLDYPFFNQKPYIRNRTVLMRNGGNDNTCRIKDAVFQQLMQSSGMTVDLQSVQPVIYYINGSLAGLMNMREPSNKHYVFANYGWDDDEIDMFEISVDSGYMQKCGTIDAYQRLYELSYKVNEGDNYEKLKQLLDVDAFVNYVALELYLNVRDWLSNNVKAFRYRSTPVASESQLMENGFSTDGAFRFVVYDLDGGISFGNIYEWLTYYVNRYWGKENVGAHFYLPIIIYNLLQHQGFRRKFIDTYCLMGGSVFQADRFISAVDRQSAIVDPVLALKGKSSKQTADELKEAAPEWMDRSLNFLRDYEPIHLADSVPQPVRLSVDDRGMKIYVNDLEVPYSQFDGKLFLPVKLKAVPRAGFRFHAWVDAESRLVLSRSPEMILEEGNRSIEAMFLYDSDLPSPVVINEVSAANDRYINEYFKKSDWLELYNNTDDVIDLNGMYLSCDPQNLQQYRIQPPSLSYQSTLLQPFSHTVVWCDKRDPLSQLHASFNLPASGATVYLSASDLSWTTSFTYPEHSSFESVGRYPDGCSSIYVMNVPTIGKSNLLNSYLEYFCEDTPQPPVPTEINSLLVENSLLGDCIHADVFTLAGQKVADVDFPAGTSENNAVFSALSPGCYVVNIKTKDGTCFSRKIVVK